MAIDTSLAAELRGLDALDTPLERPAVAGRLWSPLWPKLAAIAIFVGMWQIVGWMGLKPRYVVHGPATAVAEFAVQLYRDTV